MSSDSAKSFAISPRAFRAAIFDLDGVVTKTAKVHAAAWKQLFDDYLQRRAAESNEPFHPFDIGNDYRQYVDGRPRYDGVSTFLKSRGIELPWGDASDAAGKETICGLGNRKNSLFQERLAAQGVERYESTIALIKKIRERGMRTAIVTSSKNCVPVLQAAGALDLFDARVDGSDSERIGLNGKPAPDIFLEAARQLDVEPACAIVVEDAISGVEAGNAGKFGTVIGVDRAGYAGALRKAGANVVVQDLAEVCMRAESPSKTDARELPSAMDCLAGIGALAVKKRLLVFLDYDGTLSPIVRRPEDAVLSERMRAAVRALAARCSVAVVSGRDLADVRALVGIDEILYAGSHGFEIAGPAGRRIEYDAGKDLLPVLDQVQKEVEAELAGVKGAQVERKKFSLALHYRNVEAHDQDRVRQAAENALLQHGGLRVTAGKKVWDIQPDVDWNKGKALEWIMAALKLDSCANLPLYIGDDVTDEDAFRAVWDGGIGIVVRDEPRLTMAEYALDNTKEVQGFLEGLTAYLSGEVAG